MISSAQKQMRQPATFETGVIAVPPDVALFAVKLDGELLDPAISLWVGFYTQVDDGPWRFESSHVEVGAPEHRPHSLRLDINRNQILQRHGVARCERIRAKVSATLIGASCEIGLRFLVF
jgi:hypothetical protein